MSAGHETHNSSGVGTCRPGMGRALETVGRGDRMTRQVAYVAVLLMLASAPASAQSLDARAGKEIQAPKVWDSAEKFYSVKDDPNLMLAVGYHSDSWWKRW